MKVAVFIDHLLEKDALVEFVDQAILIFKDVDIFTIAHRPGTVGGNLEQYSIKSSYLSNIVKSKDDLLKKSFLVPGALSKLFIPCSYDLVFAFSEGLITGLNYCKDRPSYLYLMGTDNLKKTNLLSKIFSSYLFSRFRKGLTPFYKIFTSTDEFKVLLDSLVSPKEVKKISPFFSYAEYPFIPEEYYKSEKIIFFIKDKRDLDESIIEELGADRCVVWVKNLDSDEGIYSKNPCLKSMLTHFTHGKVFISLIPEYFPSKSLRAMSCGVPVIDYGGVKNSFLEKGNIPWVSGKKELIEEIQKFDYQDAREKLRDLAIRFNEIKFKSILRNQVQELK